MPPIPDDESASLNDHCASGVTMIRMEFKDFHLFTE